MARHANRTKGQRFGERKRRFSLVSRGRVWDADAHCWLYCVTNHKGEVVYARRVR